MFTEIGKKKEDRPLIALFIQDVDPLFSPGLAKAASNLGSLSLLHLTLLRLGMDTD